MTISKALREKVAVQAGNRCGYCLASQDYVYLQLEIEHIIPTAHAGTDEETNLWLACRLCNGYKGDQITAVDPNTRRRVNLFNPRRQRWKQHFYWSDDGTLIVGKTACGRATVIAMQLNNQIAVNTRKWWVSAGWHPP